MNSNIDWSQLKTPEDLFAEKKVAKHSSIKSERNSAESLGCEWNKYTEGLGIVTYILDSSRDARNALSTKYITAQNTENFTTTRWKLPTGNFIDVTIADMKDMLKTIDKYVQTLFDKEEALTKQINEAKTEEELNKISW